MGYLINALKGRFIQPSYVAHEILNSFLLKSEDDDDLENENKFIKAVKNLILQL